MHLKILLVPANALKNSSTFPCSEQDYPSKMLSLISLSSLARAQYALFRGSQILCHLVYFQNLYSLEKCIRFLLNLNLIQWPTRKYKVLASHNSIKHTGYITWLLTFKICAAPWWAILFLSCLVGSTFFRAWSQHILISAPPRRTPTVFCRFSLKHASSPRTCLVPYYSHLAVPGAPAIHCKLPSKYLCRTGLEQKLYPAVQGLTAITLHLSTTMNKVSHGQKLGF